MDEQIYKKIEIVGASSKSIENAIEAAVDEASQSLRNLRWFEVDEIRGAIDGDKVSQWQVGLKVAFTLDDMDEGERLLRQAAEAPVEQETTGPLSKGSVPNEQTVQEN